MVFEFKIVAVCVVQQTALFLKPSADASLNIIVSGWNLDRYKLHTFAVNVTFVIFLNTVIIMIGDILSPSCTFSFKQTFSQKLYTFI